VSSDDIRKAEVDKFMKRHNCSETVAFEKTRQIGPKVFNEEMSKLVRGS
jgi:hypothetical protein